MSYLNHSFKLTENQKKKLATAFKNKKAVNIKFKSVNWGCSYYDNKKATKQNY